MSVAPETSPLTLTTDMAEEERTLRRAAELAIAYLKDGRDAPPYPPSRAIERAHLARCALPDEPTSATRVIDQLADVYGAATVRSHSGRYFGFVHGSAFPAGLAAKWLSTVWDQNTPLYALSPATSLLETQVEEWLVDLLNLPAGSAAGFVTSTSQSLLTAIFVARQTLLARMGWNAREKGMRGAPRLRIVIGEQAHNAVKRALNIIGFGEEELEVVPADAQGRLRASELPPLDDQTILILQAGNIYTGAFDDFATILPRARSAGAWTHVDGAFGLWAAASPRKRDLVSGVEDADSWSADCHKTLNTPFSSGLFLCRDRAAIRTAMASAGSYLAFGEERHGMDYSPDMARRCHAAEIWATLKYLGRVGVAQLVDQLCARATTLGEELRRLGYIVDNEVVFNQVSTRLSDDDLTERAMAHLQSEGVAWCGGGIWRGRKVIRISVSSWRTNEEDCQRTLDAFQRAKDPVS